MPDLQSKHIFIVLPNKIAVRNILETPVINFLVQNDRALFTLLTNHEEDQKKIENLNRKNIK